MWKLAKDKKKDHAKDSTKYESENANKLKNELKLNVDGQQDVIKHLKNTVT